MALACGVGFHRSRTVSRVSNRNGASVARFARIRGLEMKNMKTFARTLVALCSGVLLSLNASQARAQAIGFKTGEVQTGMTKQCIYNALGSQYTLTIPSVQLCPLNVQVPSSPSYETPTPHVGRGGVGFKSGEQVTGMTKQCFYNYLGSTISRTVASVSICPLTIPVD